MNLDLWDGLTSVDGYRSINFLNAILYKTTHVDDAKLGRRVRVRVQQLLCVAFAPTVQLELRGGPRL